jgi:hypothetical protein
VQRIVLAIRSLSQMARKIATVASSV